MKKGQKFKLDNGVEIEIVYTTYDQKDKQLGEFCWETIYLIKKDSSSAPYTQNQVAYDKGNGIEFCEFNNFGSAKVKPIFFAQ